MNLETQLLTLVLVLVAIVTASFLFRSASVEAPYNKVLRGFIIVGLLMVLLSAILQLFGFERGGWNIMGFGLTILGVDIVILSWEKFKEGYEESRTRKK
ncbi:MAG: hypothetical protein R6U44_10070 [Archaeoglobaceae archaeon]